VWKKVPQNIRKAATGAERAREKRENFLSMTARNDDCCECVSERKNWGKFTSTLLHDSDDCKPHAHV
jgi:uncharacterized protein (UPF0147 family)